MSKPKIKFTRVCLKRTLRTFLQTAIGYLITNISLALTGIDFADGDVLKNTLIGLAVSALSAGAAAVMNIEIGDDNVNG
jgi:hypothetical protein